MGNSNSSKVRQRSDSVNIKSRPDELFSKSKSMVELGSKSKRPSSARETKSNRMSQRGSTYSSNSNSISRSKSLIRRDISHPISPRSREIIVQCFDNPHSDFGNRVLQRIYEKRPDYQSYIQALGKEKACQMSLRLKELVEDIVTKIYDPDYISSVSRTYGEEHVELKQFGFKPDFWVAIADAITLEGVMLDQANHQPADTVAAWSSLVTLMFTSVRDGYYMALRRQRLSSKRGLRRQNTVDSSTQDVSVDHSKSLDTLGSRQNSSEHSSPADLLAPGSVISHSRRTSAQSTSSTGSEVTRLNSVNIMAPVNGHCHQPILTVSAHQRQRPIFE